MFKPKWIMLEGPDRAGKSFQWYEVFKARNGVDTLMDRGLLASAYFHPPEQGVEYDINMLRDWLKHDSSRLIIFILSYEEQLRRVAASGHESIPFETYINEMTFYKTQGRILNLEFPDKVLLVDADRGRTEVTQILLHFLSKDEK